MEEFTVLPPPLFNYDADDLLGEWKQWFVKLEEYLTAYDQADAPDEDKIRVLLNHLGNEGKEIYESLEMKNRPGEKIKSYAELTEALAAYFECSKNVLFERFKFFKMKRKSGQAVGDFVDDLTKAASSCEFAEKEYIIRDKLLEQLTDKSLIERLLVEGGSLKLDRAVRICQKWESKNLQNENKPGEPENDPPDPPSSSINVSNTKRRCPPAVKRADLPIMTILVPKLEDPKPKSPVRNITFWDDDSREYSDSRELSDTNYEGPKKSAGCESSMCDICGKIYARPSHLRRHMNVHSGTKPYECTKCDFRAALKSTVSSHMRIHGDRKFSCDMCDFKARRSYGLKIHKMTNHSTERPFKCQTCYKGFPDVGALNYHKKTRHSVDPLNKPAPVEKRKPDESQFKHICSICGHKFISEYRYKRHIDEHNGTPFHCYACSFKTTRRNSIIRHLAQQHGSQTFTCDICGFNTKSRRRMQGHKRIHGARNITCGFCEFRSYKRATMTAHMRRHTGERPFECSFCGYKAAQRGTLSKHIAVMHDKKNPSSKKPSRELKEKPVEPDHCVISSQNDPDVFQPQEQLNVDPNYEHAINPPYPNPPEIPVAPTSIFIAQNYYNPHTNTYYNNQTVEMVHNNSPFDLDQFVRSNMIT